MLTKYKKPDIGFKNPFDELGQISITLPEGMFSGFKLAHVRAFAVRWSIKVTREKDGDYRLTTKDPKNLFWFGCNVNNHSLQKPSALSEFVQLGKN